MTRLYIAEYMHAYRITPTELARKLSTDEEKVDRQKVEYWIKKGARLEFNIATNKVEKIELINKVFDINKRKINPTGQQVEK